MTGSSLRVMSQGPCWGPYYGPAVLEMLPPLRGLGAWNCWEQAGAATCRKRGHNNGLLKSRLGRSPGGGFVWLQNARSRQLWVQVAYTLGLNFLPLCGLGNERFHVKLVQHISVE